MPGPTNPFRVVRYDPAARLSIEGMLRLLMMLSVHFEDVFARSWH